MRDGNSSKSPETPLACTTTVIVSTTFASDTTAGFAEFRVLLETCLFRPSTFLNGLKSEGIVEDFQDFFIFSEFSFQDMFY
jgi:hypothetical protein